MSIAESIVDIVKGEAEKSGAKQIKEVELEIGRLSGIEYESLEFALKVIAPGSVIEGAKLIINKRDGEAICLDCSCEFKTVDPINSCPECGSYGCNILRGKELRVSSILIE